MSRCWRFNDGRLSEVCVVAEEPACFEAEAGLSITNARSPTPPVTVEISAQRRTLAKLLFGKH